MKGGCIQDSTVTVASIGTALTTALTTTVNETLSVISGILPIALSIMGAILVVGLGIKVFKKITGR